MTQLPLPFVQALAREVLCLELPCAYGRYDIDGTVRALGWFGRHHCPFCAAEAEAK